MTDPARAPDDPSSLKLFYACADEDERFRQRLDKHLSLFKKYKPEKPYSLTTWSRNSVVVGTSEQAIQRDISESHIVVLMMSTMLFADRADDVTLAVKLARENKIRIVPIITKPIALDETELKNLQAIPRSGPPEDTKKRAVSQQPDEDTTWVEVAREIDVVARNIINGVPARQGPEHAQRAVDKLHQREPAHPSLTIGEIQTSPFLERWTRKSNTYKDPRRWLDRLNRILDQVCKITIPVRGGAETGTGFLVGPGLVLTNYHVVEDVLRGRADAAGVMLDFGAAEAAWGATAAPPRRVGLARRWLLAASRPNAGEATGSVPASQIDPGELDYALLQLDGEPGADVMGYRPDKTPLLRGWLRGLRYFEFVPHQPLFIVQHPKGESMKLAMDTDAIIEDKGVRITYRTNTDPGSSGSPCFNQDWELVALHHHGMEAADGTEGHNQGIPIMKIVAHLEESGITLPPPPEEGRPPAPAPDARGPRGE